MESGEQKAKSSAWVQAKIAKRTVFFTRTSGAAAANKSEKGVKIVQLQWKVAIRGLYKIYMHYILIKSPQVFRFAKNQCVI